jgi:hypothetical protein
MSPPTGNLAPELGVVLAVKRLAMMTPRTFCTFAREFSPFKGQGLFLAVSDSDTVLGAGRLQLCEPLKTRSRVKKE